MKNHITEWVNYHKKWWDKMFTNSIVLHDVAKDVSKSAINNGMSYVQKIQNGIFIPKVLKTRLDKQDEMLEKILAKLTK